MKICRRSEIRPRSHRLTIKDNWKNDFLKEIDTQRKTELIIEDKNYRIIGLPFYQEKNENDFRDALDEALMEQTTQ